MKKCNYLYCDYMEKQENNISMKCEYGFWASVNWALGGAVVHSDRVNNMANSYYGFTGGGPYGFV